MLWWESSWRPILTFQSQESRQVGSLLLEYSLDSGNGLIYTVLSGKISLLRFITIPEYSFSLGLPLYLAVGGRRNEPSPIQAFRQYRGEIHFAISGSLNPGTCVLRPRRKYSWNRSMIMNSRRIVCWVRQLACKHYRTNLRLRAKPRAEGA